MEPVIESPVEDANELDELELIIQKINIDNMLVKILRGRRKNCGSYSSPFCWWINNTLSAPA